MAFLKSNCHVKVTIQDFLNNDYFIISILCHSHSFTPVPPFQWKWKVTFGKETLHFVRMRKLVKRYISCILCLNFTSFYPKSALRCCFTKFMSLFLYTLSEFKTLYKNYSAEWSGIFLSYIVSDIKYIIIFKVKWNWFVQREGWLVCFFLDLDAVSINKKIGSPT